MQRISIAAAILLILQIGLVVWVNMQKSQYEPFAANEQLVDFVPETIDFIKISGKEKEELSLKKKSDSWFIAGKEDIPGNSTQIEAFLQTLARFKRGLAVATTKNGANRFEVSPENYSSHLILRSGDQIAADLYFGTSAGFKQLHTRTAESDEVVTVALNRNDVSPKIEQWIKKDILQLPQDQVAGIDIGNYSIVRHGENGWQGLNTAAGEKKELPNGGKLVEKICALNIQNVLENEPAGSEEEKKRLLLTVNKKDKSKLEYVFIKTSENSYAVNRSDTKFWWNISGWQGDELVELKNSLISAITEEEKKPKETDSSLSPAVQPE